MAAESPAETIRRAATLMRQRAEAASPGPWRTHDTHLPHGGYTATVLSGEGNATDLRAWLPTFSNDTSLSARNVCPDAEHIASWHPLVALAAVVMLEAVATEMDDYGPESSVRDVPVWTAAYDLAHACLAEVAS